MPVQSQQTPTTTKTTTTSGTATPAVTQAGGNGAEQDKLQKVSGPIGRVWNHILGQADGQNTSTASVDQAMIRAYLDRRLGFAEGEFFRGAKLDGVSEKLVGMLDSDKDGRVTWPEFQEFEGQILNMLAPKGNAGAEHGKVAGQDGQASLAEMTSANEASLPKGTEHADLIAQLGARVTIDAADKDETKKPIGQRSLSKDEWTGAATEAKARR
jgi:hypothetical protein